MDRTHQSVHFWVTRARDGLRTQTLQPFGSNGGGNMQLSHAGIVTFFGERGFDS